MKLESAKIGIGSPNSMKIVIGLESCNRCIFNDIETLFHVEKSIVVTHCPAIVHCLTKMQCNVFLRCAIMLGCFDQFFQIYPSDHNSNNFSSAPSTPGSPQAIAGTVRLLHIDHKSVKLFLLVYEKSTF